ncbi:MAG: hypothetical protein SFV15_16210 [Polyangiaceae bacterium]|nr:hypothetical protein [Polyangiaceae bacterium]
MKIIGIFLSATLVMGCATTFYGAAEFPGGASGCFEHCKSKRMKMSAFVYSGEYSTSCICAPRSSDGAEASDAGSTAAESVAVMTAMRARQQQANSANAQNH